MDLQLEGKHVLVSGGSKGIGLACAREFLKEGARVALVSRSPENLAAARARLLGEIPAAALAVYPADLADTEAAAGAAARCEEEAGPLDVLVNSAGAARRTPPEELTPKHWHDAMDAKFFTYIHMLDPVIKRMASRGAGAIVNVVGNGGKVVKPTHLPGGAANASLMLASAGLAKAYGPRGVRVNVVNPGTTLTDRMQQGIQSDARLAGITPQEALRRLTASLPLGRVATPEEIASAVLFLSSPRASYVSGAILTMDGALNPLVV
jgi:NAD(P)-dependent dehydrogenase (short-subunit alcohol dehydrogenase family)